MPNGLLPTLNASLTLLESRITAAGRTLPNIMIVAAGNYEGMTPMTPQIKERFIWYDVKFSSKMWIDYMFNKYGMVKSVTNKLINLISNETFDRNNFFTPRSIDKAVNMIINNVYTPYENTIKPILNTLVSNKTENSIDLGNGKELAPNEQISWLSLVRYKNKIVLEKNIDEEKEDVIVDNNFEIAMYNENNEIIGAIKDINTLQHMYYFSEQEIKTLKLGQKTKPDPLLPPLFSPLLLFFLLKK